MLTHARDLPAVRSEPPPWSAWWRPRPGIGWTCLARGGTYDDAQAKLGDALVGVKGGEFLIRRSGADPDAPPAGRRNRTCRR
jgi:hypothetical protein